MIRAVKSDHWAITISNIFPYKQIILERLGYHLFALTESTLKNRNIQSK